MTDAFGVQGQVKIRPFTERPQNLLEYSNWTIESRSGEELPYAVNAGQLHGKFVIAQLDGVNTRDEALQLKGRDIRIPVEDLPLLPEGEFYHFQLIGLVVRDVRGHTYGHVDDVMQTGANDVLVVKGDSTSLIPYITDVITEVDLDTRMIQVRWYPDF